MRVLIKEISWVRKQSRRTFEIKQTCIPVSLITGKENQIWEKDCPGFPAAAALSLPLLPSSGLFQNGRHRLGGWWWWWGGRGGGIREGAEKKKLSPNCHIYKALPARHRFPLFNLTHTASCLLKPCKALWSSASWAERTPQPRERGVRGIDGETEKEKIACVWERERKRKRPFYLFFGANMHPALWRELNCGG